MRKTISGLKGALIYKGKTYYLKDITVRRIEDDLTIGACIYPDIDGNYIPVEEIIEWRIHGTKTNNGGRGWGLIKQLNLHDISYADSAYIVINNIGQVYTYDENETPKPMPPVKTNPFDITQVPASATPVEPEKFIPSDPKIIKKPTLKLPTVNTYGESDRVIDL